MRLPARRKDRWAWRNSWNGPKPGCGGSNRPTGHGLSIPSLRCRVRWAPCGRLTAGARDAPLAAGRFWRVLAARRLRAVFRATSTYVSWWPQQPVQPGEPRWTTAYRKIDRTGLIRTRAPNPGAVQTLGGGNATFRFALLRRALHNRRLSMQLRFTSMTKARTLMLALLISSAALAQSAEDPATLTLGRIFDSPPLSGSSLRQA